MYPKGILEPFEAGIVSPCVSSTQRIIYLGCCDTATPFTEKKIKHNQTEQTVKRDLDDVVMMLT